MDDEVTAVELGQSYFELHHQLHRVVDQTYCAAGISLARAKVLMRLHDHGPMNQATLAGLLGFAPRSVTDTVDALERDGLLSRTDDQHDRRARILALTPAGQHAYETAREVRAKTMDQVFGSLSAEQRAGFAASLAIIRTNLPSGDTNCEQ